MSEFVQTLTDDGFNSQVLESTTPTLVDFWAEWCGPCRVIAPIIEEIAAEHAGRLQVGKMNIDDNPKTPGAYKVQAIPTLLLFKNGEVVEQAVGVASKEKLVSMVAKHL